MIMGAMARIGTVWLAITQGMTLASMVRLWTMAMASRMPRPVPMRKPSRVAERVIQA
jgi:hypothetical protein